MSLEAPIGCSSIGAEFLWLLYANSDDLWNVCVLHFDVNWHGVLPLPKYFYYLFIFSQRREA
jgi:hypothetical protein